MLRVSAVLYLWLDWRGVISFLHSLPVYALEEWVLHDGCRPTSARGTESLAWVFLEKQVQQILEFRGEPLSRLEGLVHDVIHDNHIRSMIKGRSADGHFEDQYAEAPPIYHLVVGLPKYDFGGQVLRSAAQSVSVALRLHRLRQTEVSQLHMALTV